MSLLFTNEPTQYDYRVSSQRPDTTINHEKNVVLDLLYVLINIDDVKMITKFVDPTIKFECARIHSVKLYKCDPLINKVNR